MNQHFLTLKKNQKNLELLSALRELRVESFSYH